MLWQNLSEAFANLLGARQRTLLALIGIVIGAGSVIAMINIGTIVSEESVRRFRSLGTDIAVLASRGAPEDALNRDDVEDLAQRIPEIRLAAPVVQVGSQVSLAGAPMRGQVVGTTREFFAINRIRVREGRLVDPLDGFQTFATIGARTAAGGRGDPAVSVGDQIRIGDRGFTVVGILEPVPHNPLVPVNTDFAVFVPIDATRRLTDRADISEVLLRLSGEPAAGVLDAAIAGHLQTLRPTASVEVRTARQLIEQMQTQMRLYTVLLGAIGSIALIVGGVGVMNVMLVSVTERRQEIGIRMAVGARRRDIRSLFLIESMMLSVIGGLLGSGLGIGVSWLFAGQTGWQFVIVPLAIPLGAGVSVAVGVFFGFYPALMASRLNVVDALRAGT